MKRVGKNQSDTKWLQALGKHIQGLILSKGYKSVYDFWLNEAGDHMSRATLNYIVSGTGDPKASTIKVIASLLGVNTAELFEFERKK